MDFLAKESGVPKDKEPAVGVDALFSADFLAGVDGALTRALQLGTPTTILYRRNGKLDIRVKIDLTPPPTNDHPLVYEEPAK